MSTVSWGGQGLSKVSVSKGWGEFRGLLKGLPWGEGTLKKLGAALHGSTVSSQEPGLRCRMEPFMGGYLRFSLTALYKAFMSRNTCIRTMPW